jgi:hypothetical protein
VEDNRVKKSEDRLASASNAVFIAVALLLAFFVIRNQIRPDPSEEAGKYFLGKTLQIPNVDFHASPTTVLLMLSSRCGYCRESLPFYRIISDNRKAGNIRVIAVFPNNLEEGKTFLSSQGVVADQIVEASFDALNVSAIPTIALADERGTVLQAWVGMLPKSKQKSVLQRLFL